MKTAISIPDDLYRRLEATRKRKKLSRSEALQGALVTWLKHHDGIRNQHGSILVRADEAVLVSRARVTQIMDLIGRVAVAQGEILIGGLTFGEQRLRATVDPV